MTTNKKVLRFDPSRKRFKIAIRVALFSFLFQIFYPKVSFAQSSGSGQTSSTGGVPLNQMVDPFTGDFHYSIPLMDVDGFPLTLTYDGNVTMNQEASWVGLGWNLNPGAINREMRGLPDDFDGDLVERTTSTLDNITSGKNFGVEASVSLSATNINFLGNANIQSPNPSIGASFEVKGGPLNNSYNGNGFNLKADLPINANLGLFGTGGQFATGVGLSVNSNTGIGVNGFASIGASVGFSSAGVGGIGAQISQQVGASNTTRNAKEKYKSISGSFSNGSVGIGASTSYPLTLGTPTYTPVIKTSYLNAGILRKYSLGASAGNPEGVGVSGGDIYEKYNSTGHIISTDNNKAYGYLHLEKSANDARDLLDYNRENEESVYQTMKVLPVTNLTYDIFRVSGSTGGNSFRAHRNDIGTVYNSKNTVIDTSGYRENSVSINVTEGLPIPGLGSSYTHVKGANSAFASSKEYSSSDNNAGSNLTYQNLSSINPEAETYYFKGIGETTPVNSSIFDQYGGVGASRVMMGPGTNIPDDPIKTYAQLENFSYGQLSSTSALPSNNYDSTKHIRNTIYNQLNAFEATNVGISNIISVEANTDANVASTLTETTVNRITSYRKSHHLSVIDVVKPSGVRYNYDIPVYILKEKQVVFNASLNTITDSTNLVQYSGNDNSQYNNKGRDHFYSSTTVPAYAHSFLLTSILSPDYSDRTGNGLSEDDYGNYIKLSYTNVNSESSPFKWKTPYNTGSASEASYLENNKTYTDDDLGAYTYGEKEMWYVNSIEGKNYIAKFFLSDRKDLYSVSDEGGALNTSKAAKKLDKIELYSKQELITDSTNPTPIQTVYFEYNYSLCTGFPGNAGLGTGNAGGKLTLVKVYTTYANSQKGARSPYEFSYNGSNKTYNGNNVDRWGVYKKNGVDNYNNVNFPYAYQDTSRNSAAASWSLTDIVLPSDGKIHVDYESDRYASVQGKNPMVMARIQGFGFENDINNTSRTIARFRKSNKKKQPRNVAYLDLPVAISSSSQSAALTDFEKYLQNDILTKKKLYYQCEVETKRGSGQYELVTGFVNIIGYGVTSVSPYTPYLILEEEVVKDDKNNSYKVNPIQKDAWQHLRQNVSKAIFPDGLGNSAGIDLSTMFSGLNKALNKKKFAWQIDTGKSYVRLSEPTGYKYGGGNRVKQITYSDNWFAMTGEDNYEYGLSFEYNNPRTQKSSGVVQYEPIRGNAINPYKMPVEFVVENVKYPWDYYEHLEPFGESFFDAPYVGYSHVKVNNLKAGVVNPDIGYTTYEFYTSDDPSYRTRVDKTPLYGPVKISNMGDANKLNRDRYDILGLSQGFVVEKTDMHGKLKKEMNYDANGQAVSINEYFYKATTETSKIINPNGSIENKILGRDYDFVHDLIYTEKLTGTNIKTDIYQFYLPPYTTNTTNSSLFEGYVLSSFTKVIQNYTVLDRVESMYLGAQTVTKNLAFDALTGNAIATTSDNEYNDDIKSMSYPAYWYYDGMKHAYNSINNHLLGVNIINNGTSDGIIQVDTSYAAESFFRQGDELFVEGLGTGAASFKAWVLSVDTVGNQLFLIDQYGTPVLPQNNVNVRVIRSGYRNQQSASMLSFTDLDPQMDSVQASKPVSSGAMTFKEGWSTLCGGCNPYLDSIANPFEHGILGVWRPNQSYAYQVDRQEQLTSTAVDLRTGGEYANYSPYYTVVNNSWTSIWGPNYPSYYSTNSSNWLLSQEITAYNQNGAVSEAKDVLGRYSGVLFGYDDNQKKVPVAMANNAKNTDLAFDSFEDYNVFSSGAPCTQQGHFDFNGISNFYSTYVSSSAAHTGRYSVKLDQSQSVSVTRTADPLKTDCRSGISSIGYLTRACDCKKSFAPEAGKYLISAWAKEDNVSAVTRYSVPEIIVTVYSTSTTHDTIVSNNDVIIDGWQQLEGSFTIPSGADSVKVTLRHNGGGAYKIYFDDLRIHPYNSSMIANVYDPVSMRKWAVLDSYNYATYYEYNDQGILTRIKQETTDGIKTITEIRRSNVKH